MKHYDAIRGRKPTKTELILEYLVDHPREVITPKEVAEGLGFNLQTTVTVLNRLALEGVLSKKGRGQFCYDKKDKEKLTEHHMDTEGVEDKGPSPKIDKKTAALIFKAIYNMASESTGADIVGSATGLDLEDFDEDDPVKSIQNLVRSLIDLLGKEIADDIVSIALENEVSEEKISELKHVLAR